MMRRKIAGIAGTAAMVAGGMSGSTPARIPAQPCIAEDGPGPCFWDAGRRGNGRGASFWIDQNGAVHYLDARLNRKH